MRKCDAAYIAGLFDGEGCCNIIPYKSSKNGKYYDRLMARITNTHKPVLEWVCHTVGYGFIGKHSDKRLNRNEAFTYIVSNAKAVTFLKTIRPYLIIKADLVDTLLNGKLSGPTVTPPIRVNTFKTTIGPITAP